ncbi:GNAT family protein [Aquabacter sp. CN5-332]|uniref:GNAT family N-acetyltransferase n=1 Tax=Aquabacter sp. CN5-332 TaxID=3156608 RepID=UPI0032B5E01F
MSEEAAPQPVGESIDGPPARRPAREALEGRHIHVVPFDVDLHARDVYDASHGPGGEALWTYLFAGPFPDEVTFRRYYAEAAQKPDPLLYALVDARTGEAVGHATYMRIEPANRVIEVGNILYTPALARSAAATEAMYLMMRHAFEDLGYRRYEWKCNALNAPSRRAALRLGFTFEGEFLQHMIVKGRNRDTAWFALLDRDWPRARAAFEAWLAPENFDGDGRQKRRLEDLREEM